MKILFVWPNKDAFGFKPIGLSLLSGIARQAGFEPRLFDTTGIDFGFVDNTASGESAKIFKPVDFSAHDMKKKKVNASVLFKEALSNYRPDVLAFCVLSDEHLIAAELSRVAKNLFPQLPIIWGNKYPTLNPQKVLNEFCADFVCVGEGLEAFREFLEALKEGGDLCGIPNIWAKSNGRVIKNRLRPLKQNLDDLPYADWTIYDKRHFLKPFDGKVYTAGDHMLNWGCPYHCTYCINHFYHGLYENKYMMRRYGIKRIIEEIKHLKKAYNLEFFKFHDEDFLMRPLDNLRELSRAYKDEVNIPFVIETNPKSITREKAKLLKEMNCVSASIAIETGDQKLRRDLLKRVDSESDVVRAFHLFKEFGIRTVSFNMFGIPFESRATYEETVGINRKADVQYPNIGFFYPFEGTELRDVSVREGFFDPNDETRGVYRRNVPALRFENLNEQELIEMRNVFVLYVKLPRDYFSFIKRSETQDEEGIKLRRSLLEIYDKTVWGNDGWYRDDGKKEAYLAQLKCMMNKKEGLAQHL